MRQKSVEIRKLPLTIISGICLALFLGPVPSGLTPNAWKLFVIFLFTILGIITQAASMGTMSIFGITLTAVTAVITEGETKKALEISLMGFSDSVIWLIVLSFFISRGFVKTGLGTRIAYVFIKIFGKSPLGLAYAINLADLCLAPVIPSNTARGGGIIYPVLQAICSSFDSHPQSTASRKRVGAYLTLTAYNGNLITSALFLTATAGNPLAQKLARQLGIHLTWGGWFLAASVPCALALWIMPLFLYRFYPPSLTNTQSARALAHAQLKILGPFKKNEYLMIICFMLLLGLWIGGGPLGVEPATVGFIGLSYLLIFSILTWEDVKAEKGAWDTLIWFSALVMIGNQLNRLGFVSWFSQEVAVFLTHVSWGISFPVLVVIYCLSHYFFASATAQIASMYTAFLSLGIALHIPGKPLALLLGMMTALMGTQTHYGHGPAPVFFGSGFVALTEWWKFGFFLSLIYISLFMSVGILWWKLLGFF